MPLGPKLNNDDDNNNNNNNNNNDDDDDDDNNDGDDDDGTTTTTTTNNNNRLRLRLDFVHPLQDVALHQCLPLSSVCCFPNPGGSLLLCYVVLPSSAWSSP